jgi:protein-disulfide isomerase-like protein with CxxC motif
VVTPGLFLMMMAHRAGPYATVVMVTGALMTGFTTLSAATAFRIYLSEQFPTALRGRGHAFGESYALTRAALMSCSVPTKTAAFASVPTVDLSSKAL